MARKEIIPAGRESFGETTYIKNDELKPGATFSGTFKSVRTEQYTDEETGKVTTKHTYYLKQADGTELGLNGCMSLDERMAHVSPGSSIEVLFEGKGKKKPGRRAPYLFKVFADEPTAVASAPIDKVKKSA